MQGWGLLTESGIMKLHRSWKVKNFIHGLEFFQLIADVAEAQGDFYICLFTYDGNINILRAHVLHNLRTYL